MTILYLYTILLYRFAITDAGLATAGEVAAAIADLAAFAADPQSVIGGPRIFQVWARKIPAPAGLVRPLSG